MPIISNQNPLLETIHNDILKGLVTDQTLTTFKSFLKFFNPLPCDTKLVTTESMPCIAGADHIMEKVSSYKNLVKDDSFKNGLNYLTSFIDQHTSDIESTDIENLLQICDNFFKIPFNNLDLTPSQINNITQAFFDFFASITNLRETIFINSNNDKPKIIELISLSLAYFIRLNKLNGKVSPGEPRVTYMIYSPLISYLEGLGNLTLHFRQQHDGADLGPFENNAVRLINSMTNLTSDQLSNARYAFLSKYHTEPDLLNECKRLFNTTNCDPYQFTNQYKLISLGRTVRNPNAAEPIAQKLLFGSNYDIKLRLKTLCTTIDKNNALANFLDYFKTTVKESNKNEQVLSVNFVKNLSSLSFHLTDVFKETKPKSRIYDSLYSLVLTLLKNPSIGNHYSDVLQAIRACTEQMLVRLADQTDLKLKQPQMAIETSMNILADIFHQTMDIAAVTAFDKKDIGEMIKKLSIACLKIDTCNSFSALNQFSKTLGSMVRSLSKRNKTETDSNAAQVIETTARQIIQNANNTISEQHILNLRWFYLKGRYDTKAIQNCPKVFNSIDCNEVISANKTIIQDEIPTTIIPETTTPIVIQAMNTTKLPSYSNTTNFNRTDAVKESNNNNSINSTLSNSGLSLGTSAAHGAGSGMLNAIIQYFAAKHSRRGEQTSATKAVIISSSLLAHAAFAATFPLMLYKIQEHINQGNEDEAQQLWDNLLLQALPTFISSVGLSMGLQIFYVCTQLIPNHARAIARNTVPLLGTAVNLFKNPVATGVQMATSIAISSLTYGLFNRISPVNNTNFIDVEKSATENRTFEMEPLKEEKESDTNNAINEIEQNLTPEEIFFQKNKFISLPNLDKMARYLKDIIDDTQAFSDMQNLQSSKELLQTRLRALNSLHAGLISKDFIKLSKDKTPENVEIQFKSNCESLKFLIESINKELQTNYFFSEDRNLKADLNKIEGLNSKDHTFEFKTKLGKIRDNIGFIDTIIKAAFSRNESDFKKKPQDNRRNTVCFSSENDKARYSIASSSDESSKSDGYGNTKFNDSNILEVQSLLPTRLNR
ncbi:hypothetical protein [Rickettsiella endosymbiont of Xylota segnis]|uniref:hypothetical protein n=1 Tax=Rickettsiella endosymbiont of Xylota segnis TaxID=3066238 RepID=UPI0030D0C35B